MPDGNTNGSSPASGWKSTQAYGMAIICLLMGFVAGYLLRGSGGPAASPAAAGTAVQTGGAPAPGAGPGPAQPQITPAQLKAMADDQAAPLLARLKREPKNAELLATLGNLYYDAQQFPLAADYYQRSLKIEPGNANVRVDLGTCIWYMGDPDSAIEQYKIVLKAEPTRPNALMNLGVVEWQGKMNVPAALAAWEKLLATNPNFEGKQRVEQLIAQVRKHSNLPLQGKTTKPGM